MPTTVKRDVRKSGFTLVELVLVMGIIFVLATVVAPRFSDFVPALRVKTTADRLFAWAQKARADAATTGFRHRLVFDTRSNGFWIDYEARPFKDAGKFTRAAGGGDEEPIPDDVKLETLDGFDRDPANTALKVLEFRPDGTVPADAKIVLSNDREDRVTIKIAAATSRISIETPSGQ
jgi:Tfp pilus assembly protein FimT